MNSEPTKREKDRGVWLRSLSERRQITLKTSNFNRSLGAVSVTAYASKLP